MPTDVVVTMRGPLFDGRAPAIMARMTEDLRHVVSGKGESMISLALHSTLRHPTGYYESHIKTDRAGDRDIVNDSGIIYGPWLEGVGSRNKTTRFKGYANWRRTKQELKGRVPEITERVIKEHVAELNGV